jgi:hypothetical protein
MAQTGLLHSLSQLPASQANNPGVERTAEPSLF